MDIVKPSKENIQLTLYAKFVCCRECFLQLYVMHGVCTAYLMMYIYYTKYSLDPYHTTLQQITPLRTALHQSTPHYTSPHHIVTHHTSLRTPLQHSPPNPLRSLDSQSLPELFHLMRRQFTSVEWEYIKHPQEEFEQLSRFYRLWVSHSRHACTALSTSCLLTGAGCFPYVTLTHHRPVI